jgi:hypothetical protein
MAANSPELADPRAKGAGEALGLTFVASEGRIGDGPGVSSVWTEDVAGFGPDLLS